MSFASRTVVLSVFTWRPSSPTHPTQYLCFRANCCDRVNPARGRAQYPHLERRLANNCWYSTSLVVCQVERFHGHAFFTLHSRYEKGLALSFGSSASSSAPVYRRPGTAASKKRKADNEASTEVQGGPRSTEEADFQPARRRKKSDRFNSVNVP